MDVHGVPININEIPQWNRLCVDEHDEEFIDEFRNKVSDDSIPEVDVKCNEKDNYVNMEINIPRGVEGEIEHARVKKRALDRDGRPIGK